MAEARTLLKTMPSASVAILEALCLLWHDLWKWYNQLDEDTQRSHNIDWARWIANQNLPIMQVLTLSLTPWVSRPASCWLWRLWRVFEAYCWAMSSHASMCTGSGRCFDPPPG